MKDVFLLVIFLFVTFSSNNVLASDDYKWNPKVQLRGDDYHNLFYGGSFVERADGKFLVAYRVGKTAMLSVVDSESELLTQDNASAANEWPIHTFYSSERYSDIRLQKLSNGRILLYVSEHGIKEDPAKPYKLVVRESVNGLGTDFELKSTIYQKELTRYPLGARAIGQAIEYEGLILLPFAAPVLASCGSSACDKSQLLCAISKDGGKSWDFSPITEASPYRDPIKGFGVAGDRIIVLDQKDYGSGTTTMYSHQIQPFLEDYWFVPENWESDEEYIQTQIGDMVYSHMFWQSDGYTYLLRDEGYEERGLRKYYVYRRKSDKPIDITGQAPYQLGAVGSGATWEGPLNPEPYGDDAKEFFIVTPSGNLVIYGTSYYGVGSMSLLTVGTPNSNLSDSNSFPWTTFLPAIIGNKISPTPPPPTESVTGYWNFYETHPHIVGEYGPFPSELNEISGQISGSSLCGNSPPTFSGQRVNQEITLFIGASVLQGNIDGNVMSGTWVDLDYRGTWRASKIDTVSCP